MNNENSEPFHENFMKKSAANPGRKMLQGGLLFVALFWSAFAISWLGIQNAQKIVDFTDNTKNLVSNVNLNDGIDSLGLVLGARSDWTTKQVETFLIENASQLSNKSEGKVIGTMQITPKADEKSRKTYTVSTEFNNDKAITYTNITELEGSSYQAISDQNLLYFRENSAQQWAKSTYLREFSLGSALSGGQILKFLTLSKVVNNYTVFKGVETVNSQDLLHLKAKLDSDQYNDVLFELDSNHEKNYLSEITFDYWVNPDKKEITKIETETTNLFIDEKQYNIEKTVEYPKNIIETGNLENILPSQSDITEIESTFDYKEELDFFYRPL